MEQAEWDVKTGGFRKPQRTRHLIHSDKMFWEVKGRERTEMGLFKISSDPSCPQSPEAKAVFNELLFKESFPPPLFRFPGARGGSWVCSFHPVCHFTPTLLKTSPAIVTCVVEGTDEGRQLPTVLEMLELLPKMCPVLHP